uniref:Uncharacterized protein n=1 Tax=Schizaphis graminum TaxID=13262 RepID=A0A2S2PT63_SCHGA
MRSVVVVVAAAAAVVAERGRMFLSGRSACVRRPRGQGRSRSTAARRAVRPDFKGITTQKKKYTQDVYSVYRVTKSDDYLQPTLRITYLRIISLRSLLFDAHSLFSPYRRRWTSGSAASSY